MQIGYAHFRHETPSSCPVAGPGNSPRERRNVDVCKGRKEEQPFNAACETNEIQKEIAPSSAVRICVKFSIESIQRKQNSAFVRIDGIFSIASNVAFRRRIRNTGVQQSQIALDVLRFLEQLARQLHSRGLASSTPFWKFSARINSRSNRMERFYFTDAVTTCIKGGDHIPERELPYPLPRRASSCPLTRGSFISAPARKSC